MRRSEIAIGQRFNMLTIIEELPRRNNLRWFKCRCDCGTIKPFRLHVLKRTLNKSCGCHKRKMATKHNMVKSREYASWENMIQRCTNPNSRKYEMYGGRGIMVCDEWKKSFEQFYKDMGPRPQGTSIDRIDSNKGYFKSNCKWSNLREQLINVRWFKQLVRHDGQLLTVDDWIVKLGLQIAIFKSRVIRGLSFKQALFGEVDIVAEEIGTGIKYIYDLSQFLTMTNSEKEYILQLLDSDHEEPYKGYKLRYLAGFHENES